MKISIHVVPMGLPAPLECGRPQDSLYLYRYRFLFPSMAQPAPVQVKRIVAYVSAGQSHPIPSQTVAESVRSYLYCRSVGRNRFIAPLRGILNNRSVESRPDGAMRCAYCALRAGGYPADDTIGKGKLSSDSIFTACRGRLDSRRGGCFWRPACATSA
jgi:hypothetical protein